MSVVCDRACRAQLLKFWSKVNVVVPTTTVLHDGTDM